MNRDQIKGEEKQVKGQVKEAAGKILGDKIMEKKGAIQNATGKIQKGFGDVREEVKKDR